MNNRIIICTGGRLGDWIHSCISPGDRLIGADRGALFLVQQGYKPDLALGDFDSVTSDELALIQANSGETITYDPIDKDYTDTELAFRYALDKNPAEIRMLGALGTRFDHSLANVHLLKLALEKGIPASITDAHNTISLAEEGVTSLQHNDYSHVSLLPLSEEVTGITLRGFAYPLHEATLRIGQSLGISNILAEPVGTITVRTGTLLVIQSKD
ncbi:thiamine diphosphokinase [Paenibacillus glycanilyticus]|uniref:Thiamine diphosphokinase n=1 Tax=Paenibacillus glycanilyticus TaxID=126569 RepID=A0ABQ6GET4_9BACL|nr:thiamine diphosphokinase [Paenibacillus glycanilyticus]GLX68106.1 thiamine pyrophosphokinase [Paenibacillus glycanilyticus]